MGKGKPKKGKPIVIGEEFPQSSHEPTCTCSHESVKAADGHNVDGWTDEDIRVYNDLLNERAKLEKEKSELEQKSARHHTERALLKEDSTTLENPFKPQLSGEYKFTGQSSCCLDHTHPPTTADQNQSICSHEICSRAKTKGISWTEMDTIRYYQARLASEKSQRMQSALRKQRDVELIRVKKDDEEDNASRTRKSAVFDKGLFSGIEGSLSPAGQSSIDLSSSLTESLASNALIDSKNTAILEAAKENELVVRKIRTRLDKIRHDVNAGKITPFDARVKLEQANKEMAEAERKNNAFRQMIWTAEPGRDQTQSTSLSQALTKTVSNSNGDAFSQALNVMKGFFSASDPRDVQSAITDLRSVLKINGPMSPVLQKSFQALEEMLAKPDAKGFSVDLTNSDGSKRTCTNVVDVLLSLRQTGQDPTTLGITAEELKLDKATMQSNDECAKIEGKAMKEMEKELELQRQPDAKTLLETLMKIKEKAVMASPIPPLTDIVLDRAMNDLMYQAMAKILVQQASEGATERDLAGKLTSQIISLSHRKPERYMDIHSKLLTAIKRVTSKTKAATLHQAVENVGLSMQKFVDKHREKENKEISTREKGQSQQARRTVESEQPHQSLNGRVAKVESGSGEFVPIPLQVKKQQELKNAGRSDDVPPSSLDFPAWTRDDSARLSKSILQQGEVLKSTGIMELLHGMNTGDLVNMLCGLEPGANPNMQDTAKVQLKQDLTKFLSMPAGQEDTTLLHRVQSAFENIAQQEGRDKKKGSKSKQHSTSKFLEDLPSHQSSPPPYRADQEHNQQVKVKKVPVNTPQINDGSSEAAEQPCSCCADALGEIENAAKKSLHMGSEISNMHAELMKMINAPGIEGRRARSTKAKLDLLQKEMNEAAAKVYKELEKTSMPENLMKDVRASLVAMGNLGVDIKDKGKAREAESIARLESIAQKDGEEVLTSKKNKKKRNKNASSNEQAAKETTGSMAAANDLADQSKVPSTRTGQTSTTSSQPFPALSEREQVIKYQLRQLALNLDSLSKTKSTFKQPNEADTLNFTTTFDGIVVQLEDQMLGHIEMAWHVSTANNWEGLKTWLREVFGKTVGRE